MNNRDLELAPSGAARVIAALDGGCACVRVASYDQLLELRRLLEQWALAVQNERDERGGRDGSDQ